MQRSSSALRKSKVRLDWSKIALLIGLLLVPGYALIRLLADNDGWLLLILPLAISVFAFFAYRSDKRYAESGKGRIPEATLHLISLLGGWPGAFLAQQIFRHKTSKLSFQFVFWCVVALHQFLAIDSLFGWRFTRDAFRFVREQVA